VEFTIHKEGATSMTELPNGTVNFLFTDIEGGTPLWESDPEAMRAFLEIHNSILAQAIRVHAGVVFTFVGDSFQAAFAYSARALQAAHAGQRELSNFRRKRGANRDDQTTSKQTPARRPDVAGRIFGKHL
jgi:class 3 adenylate cyclase